MRSVTTLDRSCLVNSHFFHGIFQSFYIPSKKVCVFPVLITLVCAEFCLLLSHQSSKKKLKKKNKNGLPCCLTRCTFTVRQDRKHTHLNPRQTSTITKNIC